MQTSFYYKIAHSIAPFCYGRAATLERRRFKWYTVGAGGSAPCMKGAIKCRKGVRDMGFMNAFDKRIKAFLPSKRLRLAALVFLLALAAVLAFTFLNRGGRGLSPAAVLRLTPLEYTVEADGVIESASKAEVYAPSGLKVIELYAKEGDRVREGDPLAILDTEALSLEIQRAELNIQSAEANMDSEQTSLANAVTAARNALASSELSLQSAKREYESQLNRRGAEVAVEVAGVNLDAANRGYAYNRSLFEIDGISREILQQSENALQKAQSAYDDAVRSAEESLDRAREAFEAAEIRRKTALDTLQDAIAKNTDPAAVALELQRVALQEKMLRLRDASILAPSGGVVTLANAKLGAPASGLLFIIEDDRDILVRAWVSETDIASIVLGGFCRITPAGQEVAIDGIVSLLPLAAQRDTSGSFSAVVGDDVYFIAEVVIADVPATAFIGMNVKVSFVVDTRDLCFAVPNGLIQREGDQTYVLTRGLGGRFSEVPVAIGLETRRLTEILGDGLYEGMEIYSGPH